MEHPRLLLHTATIPVRWGDMDALGHVNNTVYFRYMEQARIEWLEGLGIVLLAAGATESAVIVNASCTFLIPVTYPATLEVRLLAGRPGRSSIPTYYELRCQGDERLVAEGAAKVIWVDPATGRSAPLPDHVRAVLEAT
jgi:acyl-CoA thioester hydrolase